MGICLNASNNEIHAHQVEDIIEYIGYEDFGALERCKTDNHNALRNRVYSMYNNPGGSSIGQYESEDKDDNKNAKKEENVNKPEEPKKENEEVKLKSAVKNDQTEEKNVNNTNDNNKIENNDVNKENGNDINKQQEINDQNNEVKKENDVVENNAIQENKEQIENNQEIVKTNQEEINNNNNQEVQNEITQENKIENKEENNNNNYNNNSFNQNNENVNNENNNINNSNQQENQNVNPEMTFTDNNNNQNNQPQVQVEVEVKQENIEDNAKTELKADNNNNNTVNINNGVQNKSPDTFNKKVKLPSLNTIVSEKLLAEGAGNELLFISNLLKIEQISIKERVKYVERFCMITKDNFIIYDSKENYITIKKPLAVIPINSIINVVLFKLTKKVLSYDHFYIEFKIDTADNMNVYNQLSTFFINDNKENIIREKETALLMFKTEEKMLAKKWYVLIKYLIDIKRNNVPNQNVANN